MLIQNNFIKCEYLVDNAPSIYLTLTFKMDNFGHGEYESPPLAAGGMRSPRGQR